MKEGAKFAVKPLFLQFVELMSRRQVELDTLVASGYKSALTEERRRYCFLVDRQCSVTKLLVNYHSKVIICIYVLIKICKFQKNKR